MLSAPDGSGIEPKTTLNIERVRDAAGSKLLPQRYFAAI
jgi:hypothetical protein